MFGVLTASYQMSVASYMQCVLCLKENRAANESVYKATDAKASFPSLKAFKEMKDVKLKKLNPNFEQ